MSNQAQNLNLTPPTTHIAIFKGKEIRKTLFQNEWWFSVIDVVEALTDSIQPSKYWTAMKARVGEEGEFQLSTICRQLKLESSDGKKYETDCANTEGIFRIIQSIPSPKAEPFKRWLAKVGYERVHPVRYKIIKRGKEIENLSDPIHYIRYAIRTICIILTSCKALKINSFTSAIQMI